jgi:Spy/CpxP family protein refolding chaperone
MTASTISRLAGLVLAAALAVGPATATAQETEGMMGGYGMGPGMMGGHGGYGMGPGMMGGGYGYGMGPGMMGGYRGYGMGPGMMGGYGMGPGAMSGYSALKLSDEQRTKINKIRDQERKEHWAVMGHMLDAQSKLRDLYNTEKPDPKKVGAAYGELAKLRQQMIEAHVQAQNDIHDVLTKEQRDQLGNRCHGGWGPHGPAAH